jgi:5S rRNA maturation endonuclease (ribonuclease M5)
MVYPVARQTKAVCPLKRLGDAPRLRLGHDPGLSETGNNPRAESKMIDKREKGYQAFGAFLRDFVIDLNHLSEDGWSLLIEGPRDERALRKLGYKGSLAMVSSLVRNGTGVFGGSRKVVILTDLDREGTVLAAEHIKRLNHEGLRTSLAERRRLKRASRGVFLHIENLSRFADSDD